MTGRVVPLGDAALLVTAPPERVHVRAAGLRAWAAARPGWGPVVPAEATVLVRVGPLDPGIEAAAGMLEAALAGGTPGTELDRSAGLEGQDLPVLDIPTRYGAEDGPDLGWVAERTGLSPAAVVERHAARTYTVRYLGFAPGFAYLGSLDPALIVPRLDTPRVRVPAGSVGIAGDRTAIYPDVSPGGWRLLGRAGLAAWNPASDPPTPLLPGRRVRFVPVDALATPGPGAAATASDGAPLLEVIDGGLLTTVQATARTHAAPWGVPPSGPLDPASAAAARALVGVPEDGALLEATIVGPRLRALRDVVVGLAGADLGGAILPSRRRAEPGRTHRLLAGEILDLSGGPGRRGDGARAYVAIAGGFAVPAVLGSRATSLPGRFGGLEGRPLQAGDVLGAVDPRVAAAAPAARWVVAPDRRPAGAPIRILPGPAGLALSDPGAAAAALAAGRWTVAPDSDRRGLRLAGGGAVPAATGAAATHGVVPGTIQLPPGGDPIVLLADAGTTGGYAVAAVVVSADLGRLGRLGPGDPVTFEVVEAPAARAALGEPFGHAEPDRGDAAGDAWDDLWRDARA